MSEDKLTLCSSIEACSRANATALGVLEQKLKDAMSAGQHHKVVGLVAEYNQEQRPVKVAQKRALKLLAGGAR